MQPLPLTRDGGDCQLLRRMLALPPGDPFHALSLWSLGGWGHDYAHSPVKGTEALGNHTDSS